MTKANDEEKSPIKKSDKFEEMKSNENRVDTGSSDSTIPERAVADHTERGPIRKK